MRMKSKKLLSKYKIGKNKENGASKTKSIFLKFMRNKNAGFLFNNITSLKKINCLTFKKKIN